MQSRRTTLVGCLGGAARIGLPQRRVEALQDCLMQTRPSQVSQHFFHLTRSVFWSHAAHCAQVVVTQHWDSAYHRLHQMRGMPCGVHESADC